MVWTGRARALMVVQGEFNGTPLEHPESVEPVIVACIKISVQTHITTQVLIRSLGGYFVRLAAHVSKV